MQYKNKSRCSRLKSRYSKNSPLLFSQKYGSRKTPRNAHFSSQNSPNKSNGNGKKTASHELPPSQHEEKPNELFLRADTKYSSQSGINRIFPTNQDSDRKLQIPGNGKSQSSPPSNSPPQKSHQDTSKLPFVDEDNDKTPIPDPKIPVGTSVISGTIRTGWL